MSRGTSILALPIVLLVGLAMTSSVALGQDPEAPFPGKKSTWNGFDKYDFQLNGKPALIVVPASAAPGNPWVWHGEFFGHKPAPDIALLKRGFHIFYAGIPNMLGCPVAVEHWNACYSELTGKYGLAKKVGLVGLSRGGLYCYNWSAANPGKVACIYGDAPVCDFRSWPGGKGKGKGSPRDWQLILQLFDFDSEAAALASDKNPIDNLAALAAADVPLLHVYGDADDVVPWDENTGIIAERYRKLGGRIELIAKSGVGHHPHSLDDPTPIVEFLAHHCLGTAATDTGGAHFEVTYPPSQQEGELQFGSTYTVWIPESAKPIRGVIVHQHGCGTGACQGGQTAAFDLHWQQLARKWDCALLGPSYHQTDKANCRLWCDPRNGSRTVFLRALHDLAVQSQHPELEAVPWCLWGHSGGGFWASLMQVSDPERIIAIWLRSGTAYSAWQKDEIPKPEIPAAAYEIPVVCNPGFKEKGDPRFNGAWAGAAAMFAAYRAQGAPILFAPDPTTAHQCGESRYLAIPFFDLHLQAASKATAADAPIARNSETVELECPASEFPTLKGIVEKTIAIHPALAEPWKQYVQQGEVADATPPAAPMFVQVASISEAANEIRWQSAADLESGLAYFLIQRDGAPLAQYPEKPTNPYGRPLFQGMSYHDTPLAPLAQMRFVDRAAVAGKKHIYQVIAVNSAGLKSSLSPESSAD